jgi:hydroxyethylthiazole kinase-like uncharacterized protein yjeF
MKMKKGLKTIGTRLETKDFRSKAKIKKPEVEVFNLNTAVTKEQIQALDRLAMAKIGVPSLALMENAGARVAQEVLKLRRGPKERVVVVCGVGNNAGDGFVAFRHLVNAGAAVQIFLVGEPEKLKNDPKVNYEILLRCAYKVNVIDRVTPVFKRSVGRSAVIVDALFGVGLSRPVEDPFKNVIAFLNQANKKIVAVDVPSGLDATTGEVLGIAVKATRTVTMSCPKQGFFKGMGPQLTGKIVVADIGIPEKLVRTFRKEIK